MIGFELFLDKKQRVTKIFYNILKRWISFEIIMMLEYVDAFALFCMYNLKQ